MHRSWKVASSCAVAAVLIVLHATAAGASAKPPGGLRHDYACLQRMLGGKPRAVPGSANSGVVAQIAGLQLAPATASAHKGLALDMDHQLAESYDPNALTQLRSTLIGHLDAVPAEIAAPVLPAGCASLTGVPGYAGYMAMLHAGGSGPGVCLVNTGKEYAGCAALPGQTGYLGALGLGGTEQFYFTASLVPAGVTTVTYHYASGMTQTFHAVNGVIETCGCAIEGPDHRPSLAATLAKELPTSVTETGSAPAATYARPSWLVSDLAGATRFTNAVRPS